MAKQVIVINSQDCAADQEEEFNNWYNQHAGALFKFKGVKKIARYRMAGEAGGAPKFLAVYYFDSEEDYEQYMASPEREAGLKVPGYRPPDSVAWKFRSQYELIKSWDR